MDNFRTKVKIPDFHFPIDHEDTIMCLGSCFAEHMFQKMEDHKFDVFLNPYGILYNPAVTGEGLSRLHKGTMASPDELVHRNELWHSFSHHGGFSHPDRSTAWQKMKAAFESGREFLKKTNKLLITLGTAYVYELKSTQKIVANCHKFPASYFNKRMLSVEEIIGALESPLRQLKSQNPELEVILTVSPVRHIRDGLVENQRSKSALILATYHLTKNHDFIHYFPAYEIVLDELRDYRFFEKDMAHPNYLAVDYIWSIFGNSFFEENTRALNQRIGKIIQAAAHKPFYPKTKEHQQFLKKQLENIDQLKKEFPWLNFERELAIFKENLI